MMKHSVTALLLISRVLASSSALTAKGPGKFMRFFDTNQDGILSIDLIWMHLISMQLARRPSTDRYE